MYLKFVISALFLCNISIAKCQIIPQQRSVLWGINGHPYMQKSYKKVSLVEQFKTIQKLGLKGYRVDVPFSKSLLIKNKATTDSLNYLSKIYNVLLLPMIYVYPIDYKRDVSFNETLGQEYAKIFIQYFPNCKYVELGNEFDLKFKQADIFDISNDRLISTGSQISKNFEILSAYLRGFVNEIHKNSSTVKTMIDFSGNNTWLLKAFSKQNVNFDIIAPHYYYEKASWSDKSNSYTKTPFTEIINDIYNYFNKKKDIWITEYSYWGGSARREASANQKPGLIYTFNAIKKYPYIKAVFLYELIDEADLPNGIPDGEKHFGYSTFNANTNSLEIKSFFKK